MDMTKALNRKVDVLGTTCCQQLVLRTDFTDHVLNQAVRGSYGLGDCHAITFRLFGHTITNRTLDLASPCSPCSNGKISCTLEEARGTSNKTPMEPQSAIRRASSCCRRCRSTHCFNQSINQNRISYGAPQSSGAPCIVTKPNWAFTWYDRRTDRSVRRLERVNAQ